MSPLMTTPAAPAAVPSEPGPGALVTACLAGEPDAWDALVERYSPRVWLIARSHRLSAQDCEEVYQLTWLRTCQNLHKLYARDRFPAWLTTCARRESLKQLARSGRYVPVGDGGVLDRPTAVEGGPEDAVLTHERRTEVVRALRELPSRDRELLTLLSADPAPSYDEVSRRLGIARGSVGPLRGRALRRLEEQLLQAG
ncbi:RNA polymerase sigma factor [Streptomyces sp. CA-135486]|uniref:RNA polymerase sigma factor n=1 Tax=Streptomyces sp. CA-135486 TaxID=3240049 RepID=UPI003D8BBCA8